MLSANALQQRTRIFSTTSPLIVGKLQIEMSLQCEMRGWTKLFITLLLPIISLVSNPGYANAGLMNVQSTK